MLVLVSPEPEPFDPGIRELELELEPEPENEANVVQSWKAKLKLERREESHSKGKSGVSTVHARDTDGWELRCASKDWVAGLRRVGERGESRLAKRRVILVVFDDDKREKRFWIMARGLPDGKRKVGPPAARAMVVRISRMVKERWCPFITMILLLFSEPNGEEEERYSANWCSSRRLEP